MAKFYVGQRVRIRWSNAWPYLAGKEGVVTGVVTDGGDQGDNEYCVAPDIWGSEQAPIPDSDGEWSWFSPNSQQLEPLIPPHEACDPEFAESIRRITDSVPA